MTLVLLDACHLRSVHGDDALVLIFIILVGGGFFRSRSSPRSTP
jgi:hypothetical protein